MHGNLKTMPFAELLQWLAQGRKTGTLRIDNGRTEKRILFRDGVIVFTASTEPSEYLGHFLVSHGFITEAQLAEGMRQQVKSKVLLGKILTGMGAITEPDLDRMLRLKAEESIFDVFSWPEAEFRVIEAPLTEDMVPTALDVTGLVLEAVQRLDEWKRIREHFHSHHAVPVLMIPLRGDGLEPGSEQVLAAVNDDRSVEEICLQTHSSEFFVCQVLFDQVAAKRLKVVNPRTAPHPEARNAQAISPEGLLRSAKRHLEGGQYEQALRHYRAARALDPESPTVQAVARQAEERVRNQLDQAGVRLTAIPALARGLAELMTLPLTPQEGFIISRIDGRYDVESILKISPMPQMEAQIVFWRLLQAGHIKVK